MEFWWLLATGFFLSGLVVAGDDIPSGRRLGYHERRRERTYLSKADLKVRPMTTALHATARPSTAPHPTPLVPTQLPRGRVVWKKFPRKDGNQFLTKETGRIHRKKNHNGSITGRLPRRNATNPRFTVMDDVLFEAIKAGNAAMVKSAIEARS